MTQITIKHSNLANHPNYDVEVARCGAKHGVSVRQWGDPSRNIWFCQNCGHRVDVEVRQ